MVDENFARDVSDVISRTYFAVDMCLTTLVSEVPSIDMTLAGNQRPLAHDANATALQARLHVLDMPDFSQRIDTDINFDCHISLGQCITKPVGIQISTALGMMIVHLVLMEADGKFGPS